MSLAKSWFDHAFTSHATTERLLRPDLESGLLTQHDFDLAVSFLPGYHRYLPYLHTVLWASAAGLVLSRYKAKVRFPTVVVGASAFTGYGVGIVHYFRQHRQFARRLDDRPAFLLVLENVNHRLGNRASLFPKLDNNKVLEDIMKRREERGEILSPGLVSNLSDYPSSPEGDAMPSAAPTKAAEEPPAHRKSAWDAIREANAQNAGKPSSWDKLRQTHERQRIAARSPDQQETVLEDPRARAQTEFDAMLEIERKAARN